MNILIVDDIEDARLILKMTLESQGHAIKVASNGAQALRMAGESPPDMIISDILMPEMDGFMFCRSLKKDKRLKSVPFIFYTATYVDPEDERLAMSLGASRFIVKPIEPDKFLEIIRDVFHEYEAGQLPVPEPPVEKDCELLGMYEERISRKLDKKMDELRLYREIFTNANDAIAVISPEGFYMKQNAAHRALLGYSDDELEGMTPASHLGGEVFSKILNTLSLKGVYRGQLISRSKTGEEVDIEISAFAVANDRGDATCYIGIIRDITERKRLENQLLHSQKMEAVGQLAGGIAHDFNNILSAIVNYAYLAEGRTGEDGPLKSNIGQIISLSSKAAEITRSLLSFSRKHVINPVPLDLNTIVITMKGLLARFIGEDIALNMKLADKELVIMADTGQIEQIIMNLATNARDAMPGGGKLTIETHHVELDNDFIRMHGFGAPGHYARLTFSDTGTGMDSEMKQKIFEPFYTTKDTGKGTGLGLSIIYGIVKQHNGYINIYSEPGKGSTFVIYFRTIKDAIKTNVRPVTSDLSGNAETILLAEDEEEVRKSAKYILEEYGYKVIEAVDGKDAVQKFREHREDVRLLVLDVVMPRKNGRETYASIKKLAPEIRAIFISGYTADIIDKKGIQKDKVSFVEKPILPTLLLQKIKKALHASEHNK